MEDNIIVEDVEFDEDLYKVNIAENNFNVEYEVGEDNADN